MLATRGIAWTADDMELLEDFPDGYRYEASGGVLEVTPPPTDFHDEIAELLREQLFGQRGSEWNVRLTPAVGTATGWRIPDLAVIRRATPLSRAPGARPATAFGLVVEVASPSSHHRDRVVKRGEYAEVGIPYFWLVETEPDLIVIAHELRGSSYVETARLTSGTAELPGPFAAVVDLEGLRPVE